MGRNRRPISSYPRRPSTTSLNPAMDVAHLTYHYLRSDIGKGLAGTDHFHIHPTWCCPVRSSRRKWHCNECYTLPTSWFFARVKVSASACLLNCFMLYILRELFFTSITSPLFLCTLNQTTLSLTSNHDTLRFLHFFSLLFLR